MFKCRLGPGYFMVKLKDCTDVEYFNAVDWAEEGARKLVTPSNNKQQEPILLLN